ncbi:ABC-2 family transporter protein [Bacillus sp. THAF10]|uniref:ABC transporter permease n=1 Tax=Bacillus sp. THAF10 TaxID=2587848 RepID=UPI001268B908|nr:ABC transporter permease [Bacillus sp. THAF10]QFT87303.1 ABC-2 family transporter protein [Bacillus sp. THAF10]
MLRTFIKKDFLHLLRDKKEVLILLAMPFVLITILGFALGGNGKDSVKLNAVVAVVDHGNLAQELEQFKAWMKEEDIPEEAQVALVTAAEETAFPEMLVDGVMKGELSNFLTVKEEAQRAAAVENAKYAGVLYFPEGYRFETWKAQFFDEDANTKLELMLNQDKGLEASVVSDVVEKFTEQMRLYTVLTREAQQNNQASPDFETVSEIDSEKVTLEGEVPVNSFAYFAVGMSTMFALYVISFVAGYAYNEKTSFVYDRILLTNTSPFIYAASKWFSAVMVSFVQLSILFGAAALVYQVLWSDIVAFLLLTLCFSLVIGSMTVLITALNYRYNTQQISTVFSGFLVSIFAFLGGSFVPWSEVSETMYAIGAFTPNGAALQGYVKILSGGELADIVTNLGSLLAISVLLIMIAIPCYPKRRVS